MARPLEVKTVWKSSFERSPIKVGLEQPVRVAALFQGAEFGDRLLAQEAAGGPGGGLAVLGEIETSAGLQDDAVEILKQTAESGPVPVRDLEIQGEREAVHGVGQEEGIRPVAFGNPQVGGQAALL